MANTQLRTLAEDLEKTLADIKAKPVVPPPSVQEQDTTGVARALFEYVLQKAPEDATSETLGAALSVGIRAAALELGLSEQSLFTAIDSFVCHALRTAEDSILGAE